MNLLPLAWGEASQRLRDVDLGLDFDTDADSDPDAAGGRRKDGMPG